MILSIDDIKFRYNGHPVLENVTFDIQQGEVVAILGPNGVGKTTLLRCINGILKPSSGTIMVEDENVLKMEAMAVARHIGYVAQRQSTGKITAFDAILMGRCFFISSKKIDSTTSTMTVSLSSLFSRSTISR